MTLILIFQQATGAGEESNTCLRGASDSDTESEHLQAEDCSELGDGDCESEADEASNLVRRF